MQVSHEVPKCLLNWSKDKMDYQYALVHLLEKDEEYKNHFLECKKEGIPIYLDNSLHELGEAIGGEILIKWINILEPKHVFVPDVWEDMPQTLKNAKYWIQFKYPKNTTPIAVVQADKNSKIGICYRLLKDMGYKKIAFSYASSHYNELHPHPNKDIGKALGRIQTIARLYHNKDICDTDKIHLLGCAIPNEFLYYKGYKFIDSIDTSNPIMAAIDGNYYGGSGLINKPKSNMNNVFDIDFKNIDINKIEYNVLKFKSLNQIKSKW